jgi:hypothetical protein
VLAKVVVDTTGDADLIARSGASCESDIDAGDIHYCMNTAFLFGGVDMERWLAFRYGEPDAFAAFMTLGRERVKFFEKPFVSWRNDVALFMGPRLAGFSAVNVEDLTAVELRSRELAVGHLKVYRDAAPGFSSAFLMLGAPQSACVTVGGLSAGVRSAASSGIAGTSSKMRSACRHRCRRRRPTYECHMAR